MASICDDELYICYDNLNLGGNDHMMTKDDFVSMMNSPKLLGNPEGEGSFSSALISRFFFFLCKRPKTKKVYISVLTQHLLGNVCFEKASLGDQVNDDVVCGEWQITASHKKTLANAEAKHYVAHGYVKHYYRQVEGTWKLAGVEPSMLMESQGSMQDIFNN